MINPILKAILMKDQNLVFVNNIIYTISQTMTKVCESLKDENIIEDINIDLPGHPNGVVEGLVVQKLNKTYLEGK